MAWFMTVPFILMVAPIGRTRLQISSETPSLFVQSMVTGRVAELEDVLNATSCAGCMACRNFRGLTLLKNSINRGYMINTIIAKLKSTVAA